MSICMHSNPPITLPRHNKSNLIIMSRNTMLQGEDGAFYLQPGAYANPKCAHK